MCVLGFPSAKLGAVPPPPLSAQGHLPAVSTQRARAPPPCRFGLVPLATQPTLKREQMGTFKGPPPKKKRTHAFLALLLPKMGAKPLGDLRTLSRTPLPSQLGTISKIHLWAAPPPKEPLADAPSCSAFPKEQKELSPAHPPCALSWLPGEEVAELCACNLGWWGEEGVFCHALLDKEKGKAKFWSKCPGC